MAASLLAGYKFEKQPTKCGGQGAGFTLLLLPLKKDGRVNRTVHHEAASSGHGRRIAILASALFFREHQIYPDQFRHGIGRADIRGRARPIGIEWRHRTLWPSVAKRQARISSSRPSSASGSERRPVWVRAVIQLPNVHFPAPVGSSCSGARTV